MDRGELIVVFMLAAGSILLLVILLSPLFAVHLHYKARREKRKKLQVQYENAINSLKERFEFYLANGLVVAMEIWELPEDDVMAGLFFKLIKELSMELGKPISFPSERRPVNPVAEFRWISFRQVGLLAGVSCEYKNNWVIGLTIESETKACTVNLKDMMSEVLELQRELLLTRC